MKKFIIILLALGVAMCTVSCMDKSSENPMDSLVETSAQKDDSVVNEESTAVADAAAAAAAQNQIMVEKQSQKIDSLEAQVMGLQTSMNEAISANSELTSKIEKLENPKSLWHMLTILSLLLAVLLPCIIYITLLGKLKERTKLINSLQAEVERHSSDLVQAKMKLNTVEGQNKEITNAVNDHAGYIRQLQVSGKAGSGKVEVIRKIEEEKPRFEPQTRYAEMNSGAFFLELLSSKSETCVFELTLTSQTQGEFTILSIDKIKSVNGWDGAINCYGDVTTARNFQVKQKGKIKLVGEKDWKIVEKLEIKVF